MLRKILRNIVKALPRLGGTPPRSLWALAVLLILPAVALAQSGDSTRTHTVKKGDTLWDLAQYYMSDPFLWPEIYRINTDVVEDPHWIYPGEVLRLTPAEGIAAVPPVDTPLPPADSGVAVVEPEGEAPVAVEPVEQEQPEEAGEPSAPLFGAPLPPQQIEAHLRAFRDRAYRPLRRSEFYSSGFLSENQDLAYGKMLGSVVPLQVAVEGSSRASQFTKVAVIPPNGASYQVGDTLLVVRVDRVIKKHGAVVVPTGLARVTDVSRKENTAVVIAEYGPIRYGQKTLPIERFTDPGNVRALPISGGVEASVIEGRDRQVFKGPQDVLFIDKGRADGVAAGDLFEVWRTPERREGAASTVPEPMATLQIVHVRERTATARLLNVIYPVIKPGTTVRQIAKLPA